MSHYKPSSGAALEECSGKFVWSKVYALASNINEIRRECPVCGCRQTWHKKAWDTKPSNPSPSLNSWFLNYYRDPNAIGS